jgi:DNA-directed RNA polymerase specialized sigma subunit
MSKQAAYKLAQKLNVEITDWGNCLDITSPYGKIFSDSHIRSYDVYRNGRKELWADVIEDLKTLTDCLEENCEWCAADALKQMSEEKLYQFDSDREQTDEEIKEALERYENLYGQALDRFDGATMNSVLKLWEEAENEAISRGLIEKVGA